MAPATISNRGLLTYNLITGLSLSLSVCVSDVVKDMLYIGSLLPFETPLTHIPPRRRAPNVLLFSFPFLFCFGFRNYTTQSTAADANLNPIYSAT